MNTFVKIIRNGHMAPGKLADAELHFTGGELDGLRLIGFAIWARKDGTGQNVTFPARQFTTNGQRRSFLLLRAITDPAAQDRLREFVLQAYRAHDQQIEGARLRSAKRLPGAAHVASGTWRGERPCHRSRPRSSVTIGSASWPTCGSSGARRSVCS